MDPNLNIASGPRVKFGLAVGLALAWVVNVALALASL